MNSQVIDIVSKVKSGELSVEEGALRLQALETGGWGEMDASAVSSAPLTMQALSNERFTAASQDFETQPAGAEEDFRPDLGWWQKGWLIPFWAGTGVLVLGALLMGWAYSSQHFFWFYCSWLPMLLGLFVLLLGWWSQQARWVHVRVNEPGGRRVAISMPLPLRLAGWLLRIFGRFIPKMDEKVLEGLPDIFNSLAKEKGPMTVEVDEKDGSRVRVYIV